MKSSRPLLLGAMGILLVAGGALLAQRGVLAGTEAAEVDDHKVLVSAVVAQGSVAETSPRGNGEPVAKAGVTARRRVSLPPPPSELELKAETEAAEMRAARLALAATPATPSKATQPARAARPAFAIPTGCEGPCNAPSRVTTDALRARAMNARGCYQSALQGDSLLSGKVAVHVRISPSGRACFAKATQDSLGDSSVTGCILERFRTAAYPRPAGTCVEANVPISFVAK